MTRKITVYTRDKRKQYSELISDSDIQDNEWDLEGEYFLQPMDVGLDEVDKMNNHLLKTFVEIDGDRYCQTENGGLIDRLTLSTKSGNIRLRLEEVYP